MPVGASLFRRLKSLDFVNFKTKNVPQYNARPYPSSPDKSGFAEVNRPRLNKMDSRLRGNDKMKTPRHPSSLRFAEIKAWGLTERTWVLGIDGGGQFSDN
jgi:hypothetical protein